jgi:hypothetical protein
MLANRQSDVGEPQVSSVVFLPDAGYASALLIRPPTK